MPKHHATLHTMPDFCLFCVYDTKVLWGGGEAGGGWSQGYGTLQVMSQKLY
jgi:hypothetical protein